MAPDPMAGAANCPGRYVSPDRVLRETTPRDLIQCHLPSYVKMPKRFNELEDKDPVEITRFPGGGALITYCKEDGVYVYSEYREWDDSESRSSRLADIGYFWRIKV